MPCLAPNTCPVSGGGTVFPFTPVYTNHTGQRDAAHDSEVGGGTRRGDQRRNRVDELHPVRASRLPSRPRQRGRRKRNVQPGGDASPRLGRPPSDENDKRPPPPPPTAPTSA